MRSKRPIVAALVFAVACSGHGTRGGDTHEYVRCMSVDAPDERSGTIGAVRFSTDERTLRLEGLRPPLRIAAFRGAGMDARGLEEAALGVVEQRASLVFVLGGLGETEEAVRHHLSAFAKLRVPTIVLPGGDDVAETIGEAFEDEVPSNVFDGRRLRRVEVGEVDFHLLAGAPEGRYAASSAHCGNDEADREALEGRRSALPVLVSWAAPSGGGVHAVGRGFDGVDAGDPRVAELARRLGNVAGIFAYPATRASSPAVADGSRALGAGESHRALRIVVPRIAGPTDERDDFGLVTNGAAVLEITESGLRFVGVSAAEGG